MKILFGLKSSEVAESPCVQTLALKDKTKVKKQKNGGAPVVGCTNNGINQEKVQWLDLELDEIHVQRMKFSVNDLRVESERSPKKARIALLSAVALFLASITVGIIFVHKDKNLVTFIVILGALSFYASAVYYMRRFDHVHFKLKEFYCWKWVSERFCSINEYGIAHRLLEMATEIFVYEAVTSYVSTLHFSCSDGTSIDMKLVTSPLNLRRNELSEELDSFLAEIERRFGLKVDRKDVFEEMKKGFHPENLRFTKPEIEPVNQS